MKTKEEALYFAELEHSTIKNNSKDIYANMGPLTSFKHVLVGVNTRVAFYKSIKSNKCAQKRSCTVFNTYSDTKTACYRL